MKKNRFLAATSLALAVAAVGCTTNRYPGNGEPTITTPGYGGANKAVTPGSSSGTEGNPPMASSYVPNTDALADAAAQQGYQHQGRILGPVNPGGVQIAVPTLTTGLVIPPAMLVNPQSTVNPSVSSPNGDQAITGGVGGGGGGVVFAGAATVSGTSVSTGSGSVATASTSPLAVTGALGVGATPANGTIVPATTATSPIVSSSTARVTNGVVTGTTTTAIGTRTTASTMAVTNPINVGATPASGTIVPSAASTSPSISGNAVFAPAVSSGVVTGTAAVKSVPTTARATTSATTSKATTASSSVRSVPVTSGLKIQQNGNGKVVVSNVSTTVPSTKASTTTATDKTSTSNTTSVKP